MRNQTIVIIIDLIFCGVTGAMVRDALLEENSKKVLWWTLLVVLANARLWIK